MIVLDVEASELRPFDMLDEGRWVRKVTQYPGEVPALEVEVTSCHLIEEGRPPPEIVWGEEVALVTFDSLDEVVRVVRGMPPPPLAGSAEAGGEG